MPRKYVPKTKKTNRRPRRYRNRPRKMLSMYKAPIANKVPAKLRYSDAIYLDPGVLGSAVHVIHANCLYDVDATGTGHQPRGFDQYMQMFDHYVVLGSKLTCTFSHSREGVVDTLVVGIALRDSVTTSTNINDYLEGRNVISRLMTGHDSTTSPVPPVTLSKTCSTRKFLGRSSVMSDPELKGSATSNPTETADFHVFAGHPWAAADPGTYIEIYFVLDLLVMFIEPRQPAQS